MTDHTEAEVTLAEFWPITRDSPTLHIEASQIRKAVAALDRAGLLASDLHRRALAACEDGHINGIELETIHAIGRESLALKQPKPRWTVDKCGSTEPGRWFGVYDAVKTHGAVAFIYAEAQARAVADALNALEGRALTPEKER